VDRPAHRPGGVGRLRGGCAVTVTVAEAAVRDGSVDLWWNSSYLDEMTVDGVTPEPDTVTAIGGRVRYSFAAEAGEGPLTVTFDLTPDGMGPQRAEVAVADGDEQLTFDQLIYP
jgi:hypothetical protein